MRMHKKIRNSETKDKDKINNVIVVTKTKSCFSDCKNIIQTHNYTRIHT